MSVDDTTTTCEQLPVDGRRARRDRGREAVTEAMIDLVLEGHVPPTAEQVAARAGVSVASLFRYFETLDELRRATIQRYHERFAHLIEIAAIGAGPAGRARRQLRRVAARASTRRPSRWPGSPAAAPSTVPAIDDSLHQARATAAEQIRRHFAAELRRC